MARQDFRLFKLNRMADIQAEESFEKRSVPLPDFSPEHVFPGVYTVKALIQPSFKWRLVEEYGLESFTQQPDGTLLFSAKFTDKASIICWIASFGDGAELLEPPELRQSMLEFGEGIRRKYAEGNKSEKEKTE